jgi:hypothetical protein
MWPRLVTWYGWFNTTQVGDSRGTYRYGIIVLPFSYLLIGIRISVVDPEQLFFLSGSDFRWFRILHFSSMLT